MPKFGRKKKERGKKKMELNFFEMEMKRLQIQWPNAYSKERMIVFFNAFRDVSNFDFRDAVTHCLATCKGAPLLKELTEAIHVARNNYFQQKRIDEANLNKGMFGIENNGTADPEFAKKCVELFKQFDERKITREQFGQGCDLLDQASKLYKNKAPTVITPKQLKKPHREEDDEKPF